MIALETQPDDGKSCTYSRSFGGATTNREDVVAAISEFAQTAPARLWSEGMAAGHVQVYALTDRFRQKLSPSWTTRWDDVPKVRLEAADQLGGDGTGRRALGRLCSTTNARGAMSLWR